MTARIAKIVVATRRLRWSSPLLFNDPFDVTQELRLNFDADELHVALTERVAWLLQHANASTPPIKHRGFGALIRHAMRLGSEGRGRMASELRQRMGAAAPAQAERLKELRDTWSAMVPTFRILCLSELNDVVPMWCHYADKYQGVVCEFLAAEEVDSAFQVARPVVYQDAPSIAEAQAWVSCILSEGQLSYQDLFMEYLCVKTPAWSYEREWRIPVPGRRPDDSELFGDYGFNPRELAAIYFGPMCSEEDRADLLKLLTHGLEHVRACEIVFDTQHARLVSRPLRR